jgi:hypothetical protein
VLFYTRNPLFNLLFYLLFNLLYHLLYDLLYYLLLYILGPGSYPLIADIVVFLAYVGSQVTQADTLTASD